MQSDSCSTPCGHSIHAPHRMHDMRGSSLYLPAVGRCSGYDLSATTHVITFQTPPLSRASSRSIKPSAWSAHAQIVPIRPSGTCTLTGITASFRQSSHPHVIARSPRHATESGIRRIRSHALRSYRSGRTSCLCYRSCEPSGNTMLVSRNAPFCKSGVMTRRHSRYSCVACGTLKSIAVGLNSRVSNVIISLKMDTPAQTHLSHLATYRAAFAVRPSTAPDQCV
jgi:hypothetical protein